MMWMMIAWMVWVGRRRWIHVATKREREKKAQDVVWGKRSNRAPVVDGKDGDPSREDVPPPLRFGAREKRGTPCTHAVLFDTCSERPRNVCAATMPTNKDKCTWRSSKIRARETFGSTHVLVHDNVGQCWAWNLLRKFPPCQRTSCARKHLPCKGTKPNVGSDSSSLAPKGRRCVHEHAWLWDAQMCTCKVGSTKGTSVSKGAIFTPRPRPKQAANPLPWFEGPRRCDDLPDLKRE